MLYSHCETNKFWIFLKFIDIFFTFDNDIIWFHRVKITACEDITFILWIKSQYFIAENVNTGTSIWDYTCTCNNPWYNGKDWHTHPPASCGTPTQTTWPHPYIHVSESTMGKHTGWFNPCIMVRIDAHFLPLHVERPLARLNGAELLVVL